MLQLPEKSVTLSETSAYLLDMIQCAPYYSKNLKYAALVLKDLFLGKHAVTVYPIDQLPSKPLDISKKITEDRVIEVLNDNGINIDGTPNFSGLYALRT